MLPVLLLWNCEPVNGTAACSWSYLLPRYFRWHSWMLFFSFCFQVLGAAQVLSIPWLTLGKLRHTACLLLKQPPCPSLFLSVLLSFIYLPAFPFWLSLLSLCMSPSVSLSLCLSLSPSLSLSSLSLTYFFKMESFLTEKSCGFVRVQ